MTTNDIHKDARSIFNTLALPVPLQKNLTNSVIKIDLSNSTNPFTGHYAHYPEMTNIALNQLYMDTIVKIEQQYTPDYQPKRLEADHLMFTVGSSEGIDLLMRAFCEPHKDCIATMDPTFSAYAHWGAIQAIKTIKVPLTGDDLSYVNIPALIQSNPKIIFICNPNNPTGTILQPGIIEQLCQATDALVVVDEAYNEIADMSSALPLFEKYPNLVILRTLSKGWGMAGLRCGWIIADPSIINVIRYIQIPFGLSTPSQQAIIETLKLPQSIFKSWQMIREQRDMMTEQLRQMACVKNIYKSYTNYMFITLNNFDECLHHLQQNHIYVANFSKVVPNSIKVSVSSVADNAAFLECLKNMS